jgi:ABC-type antimicrobial peptide transport system permease subunit
MIAFAVTQRRQEIGIRIALGARRGQVITMVVREAARLLIAGTLIGIAVALLAGRTAASLLFGITSSDPLTLAAAILLLTLIALAATLVPARSAAHLDPLIALRHE